MARPPSLCSLALGTMLFSVPRFWVSVTQVCSSSGLISPPGVRSSSQGIAAPTGLPYAFQHLALHIMLGTGCLMQTLKMGCESLRESIGILNSSFLWCTILQILIYIYVVTYIVIITRTQHGASTPNLFRAALHVTSAVHSCRCSHGTLPSETSSFDRAFYL